MSQSESIHNTQYNFHRSFLFYGTQILVCNNNSINNNGKPLRLEAAISHASSNFELPPADDGRVSDTGSNLTLCRRMCGPTVRPSAAVASLTLSTEQQQPTYSITHNSLSSIHSQHLLVLLFSLSLY